MAIDYIIGALQLLSAAVNVLALAAFWITPGLRTTANRFVINLLVVNIIGCLALTPALFLHGGLKPEAQTKSLPAEKTVDKWTKLYATTALPAPGDDAVSKLLQSQYESKCGQLPATGRCDTMEIEQKMDSTDVVERSEFDDDGDDVEIIGEILDDGEPSIASVAPSAESPAKNLIYSDCTRFWGFDLVAALGELIIHCQFFLQLTQTDRQTQVKTENNPNRHSALNKSRPAEVVELRFISTQHRIIN